MITSIIGTGLSGLVGSRIVELLSPRYEFTDLSYDTGVDITNKEAVFKKIVESSTRWILHVAAKADVDACERDKPLGKNGAAWKINVIGTENIVEAAKKFNKRVLYISTDFVFDGTQEFYSEEDTPRPLNWYAVTKYEGEKLVLSSSKNVVVRIAYPYRAKCPIKKDFVHAIIEKLNQGATVEVLEDHIFTPTFIDDIAVALTKLIESHACGIYHVVGSSSLTPFAAAQLIAQEFDFDTSLIKPTKIATYYQNRAKRPYKLRIKNAKIVSLDVRMHAFVEGLKEIKKQGII